MRDKKPLMSYQLTPPVDLCAALDRLECDHLIVDTGRMLVIFRNTVLNVEIRDGILESAGQVAIEVLDAPPQTAATGTTLIEQFLTQLETTTETDWRDTSADN